MFDTSDLGARNRKLVLISAKSSREIDRRKRKRCKVLPLEVMMSMAHRSLSLRGPNMSEKIGGSKLYAFPLFDKCDSLLFFPSTFAALLNSADLPSLTKLLKLRTDKNCAFHTCGQAMDLDKYMNVFEMVNELHPDSVTCVHQTKVIENKIHTVMYFKYTENKTIRSAVERTLTDEHLLRVCPTPRSVTPAFAAFLANKPDEEHFRLKTLICSDDDMVMYGQATLVLTFDDVTRKITRFEGNWECTSFGAVE